MGWIINNPIGTMYGPNFLVFYFVVITITTVLCVIVARQTDRSMEFSPVPLPMQPDAFDIAYLRGGSAEVARLIIYDLVRRQMLITVSQKPTILQAAPNPLDTAGIPSIYSDVYSFFLGPKMPHEFFKSNAMKAVEAMCGKYADSAVKYRLLVPAEQASKISSIKWTGILIVLALGGYKLTAALSTGHSNVGFLVGMGLIGAIVVGASCKAPRLTLRGKQYLNQFQTAFGQLRRSPNTTAYGLAGTGPLLAVGLFGFAALAGSEHAAYGRMFSRSASSSGCSSGYSSCSTYSSCGSGDSGSSGGGDGGGGGGCGGCGGGGGD